MLFELATPNGLLHSATPQKDNVYAIVSLYYLLLIAIIGTSLLIASHYASELVFCEYRGPTNLIFLIWSWAYIDTTPLDGIYENRHSGIVLFGPQYVFALFSYFWSLSLRLYQLKLESALPRCLLSDLWCKTIIYITFLNVNIGPCPIAAVTLSGPMLGFHTT